VDGDANADVETRIRIGWNKFRQLVPLLTNKDMSLIMRGRLYSSCVRAEMRMVRWMCGVKLKDRLRSKELRETRYR